MKLIAAFLVVGLLSSRTTGKPKADGNDGNISGQLVETFEKNLQTLMGQVKVIQESFTALNRQVERMISSGSRMVAGLQGENGDKDIPIAGGLISSFLKEIQNNLAIYVNQMRDLQAQVTEMNNQFSKLVSSGTRMVAGMDAEGNRDSLFDNNIVSTMVSTLSQNLALLTEQINQFQKIATSLNENFSRLVSSGSRLIAGLEAEDVPNTNLIQNLVQMLSQNLRIFTSQLNVVQSLITRMNDQMRNFVSQGSRLVSGLQADTPDLSQPLSIFEDLIKTATANLALFRDQIQVINSMVTQMNTQFTRLISSGTRMVAGVNSGVPGEGSRLPQLDAGIIDSLMKTVTQNIQIFTGQIQVLQKVLTDINGQFSRLVSQGSRMVAGLEGENEPGNVGANFVDILRRNLEMLTNQLAVMRNMIASLSTNVSKLVSDNARIVAGIDSDGKSDSGPLDGIAPNIIQTLLKNFQMLSQHLQSLQQVASSINGQVGRLVSSGSRMVAGQNSANDANKDFGSVDGLVQSLTETLGKNLEIFTRVMNEFQTRLTEVNGQFSKLVSTGSRIVAGQDSEKPNKDDANAVERLLQELREQIELLVSALQRDVARPKRQSSLPNPMDFLTQIFQIFTRILDTFTAQVRSVIPGMTGLIGGGGGPNPNAFQSVINTLDELEHKKY